MLDIHEVAENIYLIDNQIFSIPKFGGVYLLNEDKKALIDTGPGTSASTVLDGIKKIGVRPEDIAYVIITHIHLDHAGGAGVLLKEMPRAQVLVHYRGAPHLINPGRLVNSVVAVQGKEVMAKYGEVLPIETHRVQAIHEGDTIRLSEKQILKFLDTPGHAPHELCIYETRHGGLFVGDAVAVSLEEHVILLPFHPPPHFNLELCHKTLERLAKLAPTKLYYSHFGVSHRVQEDLRIAGEKLQVWDDIVVEAVRDGAFDDVSRRLVAQACAELEPMKVAEPLYEYLIKAHIPVCAAGHIKYYQEALKLN